MRKEIFRANQEPQKEKDSIYNLLIFRGTSDVDEEDEVGRNNVTL